MGNQLADVLWKSCSFPVQGKSLPMFPEGILFFALLGVFPVFTKREYHTLTLVESLLFTLYLIGK